MFSDISLYAKHLLDSNMLQKKLVIMALYIWLIELNLSHAAFTPLNHKKSNNTIYLTGQVLIQYF